MAQGDVFQFGIEIELLLQSPKKKHCTWDQLARDLSTRLTKVGFPHRVGKGQDYTKWSIVREITVQGDDGTPADIRCCSSPSLPFSTQQQSRELTNPFTTIDQYGIEFVSPIYAPSSLPTFRAHVTTLFKTIFSHTPIVPSPTCSSHIHISHPSLSSPPSLAALARATLYFESALDALMPPHRTGTLPKRNHWAQPNRSPANPALANLSLAASLAKLDETVSDATTKTTDERVSAVVEVMNSRCRSHSAPPSNGQQLEGNGDLSSASIAVIIRGKTYKWDFSGLLPTGNQHSRGNGAAVVVDRGIQGTVEFRQPPGSGGVEDAVGWAVLGVAFVAGAVAAVVGEGLGSGSGSGLGGEEGGREGGGSVGELRGLLEVGRQVVGWEGLEGVEGLLRQGEKREAEGWKV